MFLTETREVLLSKEESEVIRDFIVAREIRNTIDFLPSYGIVRKSVDYRWEESMAETEPLKDSGYDFPDGLMRPIRVEFGFSVEENLMKNQKYVNWDWDLYVSRPNLDDEGHYTRKTPDQQTCTYEEATDQLIFSCEGHVFFEYLSIHDIEEEEWCPWRNEKIVNIYPNVITVPMDYKFQIKFQLTR